MSTDLSVRDTGSTSAHCHLLFRSVSYGTTFTANFMIFTLEHFSNVCLFFNKNTSKVKNRH